uniref:Putative ribonuclease 3-like n=1 Tax=Davidia involucrata TaxID=16924 RepID=A0A5B6YZ08_DAVIN
MHTNIVTGFHPPWPLASFCQWSDTVQLQHRLPYCCCHSSSWPSIRQNYADTAFWNHEWKARNKCSSTRLSPLQYFQAGIRERNKINLFNILQAANIFPSNTTLYKKADIVTAVQRAIGNHNIYVSCIKQNNIAFLYEIYICLDVTATQYVSCPWSINLRGCGFYPTLPTIKFPTV